LDRRDHTDHPACHLWGISALLEVSKTITFEAKKRSLVITFQNLVGAFYWLCFFSLCYPPLICLYMKIQVDENNEILLTEVYSGVGLKTQDGEFLGVCMRDTGFEFNYNGTWYEAKKGVVQKLGANSSNNTNNDTCCNGG
jgi:hypothetical protein